jgi:hypothetical protein
MREDAMAEEKKEPQSYGSQGDWVRGSTGEKVNDQKSTPPPEHAEFYDERRESESNHGVQGGLVSPVQMAENAQPSGAAGSESTGEKKLPAEGDSYFRKRDYE